MLIITLQYIEVIFKKSSLLLGYYIVANNIWINYTNNTEGSF